MKNKNANEEFQVGKHNIGWINSDFTAAFAGQSFTPRTLGSFRKLGKYMENADMIERELNPGKCDLGDVLVFLENPPEGTKDGWANLFLVGDKVVSVVWDSVDGDWYVYAWDRGGAWRGSHRVFSPGLEIRSLDSEPLNTSDPLTLAIQELAAQVKRVADVLEKKGKSKKAHNSKTKRSGENKSH